MASSSTYNLRSKSKPIPVTLLSGFLGSGKTTLLKHILENTQKMKVAVIVNDMAELNIDAALVKQGNVIQQQEELVEMQNGCICCTLRGDLIRELSRIAKRKEFEYCVIESTGISEPQQVAETFLFALDPSQDGEGGDEARITVGEDNVPSFDVADGSSSSLVNVAKLDTCVTVVDATNFELAINDIRRVQDIEDGTEGDERTLAHLMIDQIEFADVILLNKTDLVPDVNRLNRIRNAIIKLNPRAKLIDTVKSKVDLKEILNTGLFDFETAATSPGWLQNMKGNIVPETEEYGVNSLVFRARRPFHPQRLYDLLTSSFALDETEWEEGDEGENQGDQDENMPPADANNEEVPEGQNEDDPEDEDDDEDDDEDMEEPTAAEVLARKEGSVFKTLIRAKGFLWLATRNDFMGSLSQAGVVATLSCDGPWLCTMPEEELANMVDVQALKKDMLGDLGDRRQELVLIGAPATEVMVKALEDALVTDEEWAKADSLEDPFEPWAWQMQGHEGHDHQ